MRPTHPRPRPAVRLPLTRTTPGSSSPRSDRRSRQARRRHGLFEWLEDRTLLSTLPTVTTGPAVSVTAIGATLEGTSNLNVPRATAAFQYSTDPSFRPAVKTVVASGLTDPLGVAVDKFGALYVADSQADSVKEVRPDGTVVRIGSGLSSPEGVAVDAAGDVFVSESGTGDVLEFRPDGTVKIVASGFVNVTGVAVDALGDVFVGESAATSVDRGDVKKVSPDGSVSTIASGFGNPIEVAVDGVGDVYVADASAGVTKVLPDGTSVPIAPGLIGPQGVAVDGSGDVFISGFDGVVREIRPDGSVATVDPSLAVVRGMAVDGLGDVFGADAQNGRVIKLSPPTVAALPSVAVPFGISADLTGLTPGTTYYYRAVADGGGVTAVGSTASFTTLTPSVTTGAADAVTAIGATLHASVNPAGTTASALFQYSTDPSFPLTVRTVIGSGFDEYGVAADNSGDAYVVKNEVDDNTDTLQAVDLEEVTPDGAVTIIASGLDHTFNHLAVDATGDVFVSQFTSGVVTEYRPDGTVRTAASGLESPLGVAVDAAGDLFVTEQGQGPSNGDVKEILPDGSVRNLALGIDLVTGVAVDASGRVYFTTDSEDGGLYEILPDGTVMPIGPPVHAEAVTVDGSGDVFVGTREGDVTEFMPDGTVKPVASGFGSTNAVAVDGSGDVYVAGLSMFGDQVVGTHVVKLSPPTVTAEPPTLTGTTATGASATLTGLAAGTTFYYRALVNGSGVTAVGSSASFTTLTPSVTTGAADAVTAIGATLHASVDPAGTTASTFFQYSTDPSFPLTVTTVLGAGFLQPTGVAVDSAGDIFVADDNNNAVDEILPDGTVKLIGSGFNHPIGVAVDAYDNVFVADSYTQSVKEVRPDGSIVTVYSSNALVPTGVAVDAAGNIYVTAPHALTKVATDGSVKTIFINNPFGVAVDAAGDIFVADPGDDYVIKLLPDFTVYAFYTGFVPAGVAVDGSGDLYVSDTGERSITEVLPDGTRRILKSGFVEPTGVAVDAAGDVFVADAGASQVVELSPPTAAATPSPLTGTEATPVAATLTGLTPGTTYYFRAVADNFTVGPTQSFTTPTLAATQLQVQSQGSSVYGEPVTFTVTVSPVAPGPVSPTGTVTFYDGSTVIATGAIGTGLNAPGTYAFSIGSLSVGSHTIRVTYSGDSAYSGATTTATFRVTAVGTRLGLTSSANPALENQTLTFTATVSQVAPGMIAPNTGAVQFAVDNLLVGFPVPLVDGEATLTTSLLSLGSHVVTASFVNAGPNFKSSTGKVLPAQTIWAETSTTLAASVPSPVYGQPEYFTADVSNLDGSDVPTGTVGFYVDGVLEKSVPLFNGRAVYAPTLPASSTPYSVHAKFTDSGFFYSSDTSQAPLTVTVSPAGSTATLGAYTSSATFDAETVTIPVSVTANAPSRALPTGSVTFYIGGSILGKRSVPIVNGVATLKLTGFAAGTYTITAAYAGSGNIAPSPPTDAATVTIAPAASTATLGSYLASSYVSQANSIPVSVTINAPSTAVPTGLVDFYLNGGTTVWRKVGIRSGVATLNLSTLPAATYSITASYEGNANIAPSPLTDAATVTITQAATTTTLDPVPATTAYGTPLPLNASVSSPYSGAPIAGRVRFYDGLRLLGSSAVDSSGLATFNLSSVALIAGPHAISAVYQGNSIFQSSATSAAQSMTVNPATTSITGGVSPANGGETFSGMVVNHDTDVIPVGTVQILIGGKVKATAAVSASGTWATGVKYDPVAGVVSFVYQPVRNTTGTTNFAGCETDLTFPTSESLSGQIYSDLNGDGSPVENTDPALAGWTVELLDSSTDTVVATTTSDTAGNYSFTNLPVKRYTIQEELQPGWLQTFSAPTGTYLLPAVGGATTGLNFGNYQLVTFSGTVFNDLNGDAGGGGDIYPGLQGWTVNLLDPAGNLLATTTSDVDGGYEFANLGPGEYLVSEVLPDVQFETWIPTTPLQPREYAVAAVSGINRTGLDFGNFKLVSVSGTVYEDYDGDSLMDGGNPGLEGWTVNLLDDSGNVLRSTTSDRNGDYDFVDLGPGDYHVVVTVQYGFVQTQPAPVGYSFRASSGSNVVGDDFGVRRSGESFEGQVYNDLNGDGTDDFATDPGLAGRTVLVLDSNNNVVATMTTDAYGLYVTPLLPAQPYMIEEVIPAGWAFTQPTNPPGIYTVPAFDGSLGGADFGNVPLPVSPGGLSPPLGGNNTPGAIAQGAGGWAADVVDITTNFSAPAAASHAVVGKYPGSTIFQAGAPTATQAITVIPLTTQSATVYNDLNGTGSGVFKPSSAGPAKVTAAFRANDQRSSGPLPTRPRGVSHTGLLRLIPRREILQPSRVGPLSRRTRD